MDGAGKQKQMAGSSRLSLNRPKLTRAREVQACQQCRSRKVRCDRRKPQCQTCLTQCRPCSYARSAGAPQSGRGFRAIPSSRDAEREMGRTISLNQNGVLTGTDGNVSRYFASSSWVAAAEICGVKGRDYGPEEPRPQHSRTAIENFINDPEVDRLISWYASYCHFWHPFVDMKSVVSSVQCLRNRRKISSGTSALIAAICYSAASSITISDGHKLSCTTPLEWSATASQLLTSAGYPLTPNLDSLQAAFLLATPSTAEENSRFDPVPVSVLVRAAQSLGLHREPSSLQIPASDTDVRRVLWWCIYALDVSYALAHALPPLIHPATFDVAVLDSICALDRKLIATACKVSVLLSKMFQEIYGVNPPTYQQIRTLDDEVMKIWSEEVTDSTLSIMTTLERFIALSRRMCCWKIIFVLHQPYLRANQWSPDGRQKALSACRGYIDEFVETTLDTTLSPYRWVLRHFNMIHPCAIILQDLIQNPRSPESYNLRETVDKCFSALSSDPPRNWAMLQSLRDKAWAANLWRLDEEVDSLLWRGASPLDWDPLFASFNWEDMLLFCGEASFSLRMIAKSDESVSGLQKAAIMQSNSGFCALFTVGRPIGLSTLPCIRIICLAHVVVGFGASAL